MKSFSNTLWDDYRWAAPRPSQPGSDSTLECRPADGTGVALK
jgi:hypothetical protein